MGEHVKVSIEDGVGILHLDRAKRFNSLDVKTAQDFREAGLLLSRDERVKVVVLKGAPGAFCSGADLKYIREGGDDGDLSYLTPRAPKGYGSVFKQILEYIHSAISEIRRAPKPFIAAVDGIAAAGGLGIALACDLVIASDRSTFEWAYGKTGLTGAESSTFFLPRLVGLRFAQEMVFLNPRLSADDALKVGLITGVFPAATFEADVLAIAKKVALGPTRSYAVSKTLLNLASGGDRLDFHLDQELEALARSADSPEFAEGIKAFFEKREARFA
ncbi:MAG TPA: enoyl-CoA hydratase-related protein [Myxococcales bacterium]|nr:enoyl-CoA hydratase-related protein [Myxococcales bacterium]